MDMAVVYMYIYVCVRASVAGAFISVLRTYKSALYCLVRMRKRAVSPAPPRPAPAPAAAAASPCMCCGIDFDLWLPSDPSKRWAEIFNIL